MRHIKIMIEHLPENVYLATSDDLLTKAVERIGNLLGTR